MGMNGMNMGKIMKQAQEMQKKMAAQQSEIENSEFTGVSPEELVTVTFGGNRRMKDMQIKAEAIDPDDPDMLSDLVLSARMML